MPSLTVTSMFGWSAMIASASAFAWATLSPVNPWSPEGVTTPILKLSSEPPSPPPPPPGLLEPDEHPASATMVAAVATAAASFFFTTISLDDVNVTVDPDIGCLGQPADVKEWPNRYD